MAIQAVQTAQNSALSSATLTVTLPQATGAGNCLVVWVSTGGSTTNPSVSGITLGGAAGNFAAALTAGTPGGESIVTCWLDPGCAGGQTSVAVSVTGGAGTQAILANVMEVAGLPGGTSVQALMDQSSGASGNALSWSSGTAAPSSFAAEFWSGMVATDTVTITGPVSPWTNLTVQSQSGAGFSTESMAGYQVVTSPGQAVYSGTFSGSHPYLAGVVALKGLQAAPSAWAGPVAVVPFRAGR